MSFDPETCVVTNSGEHPVWLVMGQCIPGTSSEWPSPTGPNYPKDEAGDPLSSYGGCNGTDMYYNCPGDSSVYQDINDFSGQFPDVDTWWYLTSIGSDGKAYKCMFSYKNSSGQEVLHGTCDYHEIDPVGSSDCLNQEAFDALNNTNCSQQNAFDSGIYTVFDDPASTTDCVSENCIATGMVRPEGALGCPSNNSGGQQSGCNSQGSPAWSVNVVNMNIFITDTPLWYDPPIGPSVNIQVSYNSQASIIPDSPFGNKWTFHYNSNIIEDAGGNVTITLPDGRQDVFTPDGQGGYTKLPGVFTTLLRNSSNDFELKLINGTVYHYRRASISNPYKTLLTSIKDVYSRQLSIFYKTNTDKLDKVTDAVGNNFTFTDNEDDGLIDEVSDSFGRSAYFYYEANRNLFKITDMGGIWSEFTYDANSFITSIQTEKGKWSFNIEPADGTYNDANPYPAPGQSMWENYRITITDPLANREEYHYHGMHTWYISPRDYVPYTSTDVNNYKSAAKTYYFLNRGFSKGGIRKIQFPEGGYIGFKYDPLTGKPSRIADFHGNGVTHNKRYSYNSNGLLTSQTDTKGNKTSFIYNTNNIDVNEIRYDYGSTPTVDENILLKTFTYNGNTHDVSTITDSLGNITEFTYNSYGQATTITQAKGTSIAFLTEMVYDAGTHELMEINKAGNTVFSYAYDPVGRIDTSTDARGVTLEYEYNNLNKITEITYPDNRFEAITYSTCCPQLIESRTERSGLATTYTYDSLRRLVKVQGPFGIIRYAYDKNGNMTKLTDADAKETVFQYDLDNRLVKIIYSDGKFNRYEYDFAGILTKVTNARNIEKIYSYDESHNIININYSDTTPDVTFTYSEYDFLETMSDGTGLHQYTYDELNRLKTIEGPWLNDTVAYTYNALGQIKTVTPEGGQARTYYYDYDPENPASIGTGRIVDIQVGTNTYTYKYTGVNPLVQKLTRPNGSVTDYIYGDPLKRLTSIDNNDSTAQTIDKHIFTYNNYDLINTETITTGTALDSFTEGLTTYNYNYLNQLLSSASPSESFTYDDDGSMTQGYTPDGYKFAALYDAENRLMSLEYTDAQGIVQKTEYYYNGNGFLAQIKKKENNVAISDVLIIRNGFPPVQERDGSNNVTREYTWGLDMGGGIGGLLNLREGGSDYSYLYDGKGNVMALIDSTESIVASYRYDAFGKLLKETGTFDQPFRFSTKRYDDQAGLYNFGYRYYNPAISRWMTRDPLGEAGGINLYGFVGNNPVNFVDPWGLWTLTGHRNLTERAAFFAMFNKADRSRLIQANIKVDRLRNQLNNPAHYMPGTRNEAEKIIQNTFKKAVAYELAGNHEKAIDFLGSLLHTVQDKYAHHEQEAGWFEHLPLFGTDPDNPSLHPSQYNQALNASIYYLNKFMQKNNQGVCREY
jgi:RHS repeat-associated protein